MKPAGSTSLQAANVIHVLNGAGLGVTAQDDECADEIEAHLADGRPGVVIELPEAEIMRL